jgi:hypothetical protein
MDSIRGKYETYVVSLVDKNGIGTVYNNFGQHEHK